MRSRILTWLLIPTFFENMKSSLEENAFTSCKQIRMYAITDNAVTVTIT